MIEPVSVTVAPTGTSPVHTAPVVPIDRVPELAVSFPASLIWSAPLAVVKLTLIPLYGVCPVSWWCLVNHRAGRDRPRARGRDDRQRPTP